jgi:hypothetical protein
LVNGFDELRLNPYGMDIRGYAQNLADLKL